MGHRVTAPLVQLRLASGSFVHLYEGAVLPDEADPDHVKQLLEAKMVAADDSTSDGGGGLPAGNASTEEWRAYAVAHGMSEEEAEGLGRDELRQRFDG